jgi:8-oxo-dGTP pyrophosphatase MutT (NUDIX family)
MGLALGLGARAFVTPVAFGANAILAGDDGRVLLVSHRYQPGLHLPGGGVAAAEPPDMAVMRELKEEVGLLRSASPEFIGLYTRKIGWATNLIALYCVRGAEIDFKPNFEIRKIVYVDPAHPPPETSPGTKRRLAEFVGAAARSPYW